MVEDRIDLSKPIGVCCHYLREPEGKRYCLYTECGCPFDDGNPIVECAMYRAIIQNHKALGIESEVEE